jgi:DNA-binding IclR family transcriptional regulator
MAGSPRVPKIQSLARADAILGVVARAPLGRTRLTDIAAKLSLHKNTVFSLLETLVALGYLRQLPSREYVLDHRLMELARANEADLEVVQLARPLMLRMVSATRESACIAVPTPKDVLIVNTIEGSHGVRGARYRGGHSPYHASALGKAMLAFMAPSERDAILATGDLPRYTNKTIKSRATLLRHLDEAARHGFAVALEEEEIGANAVAAPLVTPLGEVMAAIAIWGPAPRLPRDRLVRWGAELARECRGVFAGGEAIGRSRPTLSDMGTARVDGSETRASDR